MDDREKLIEILRKPIFPHELVDPIEAVADYLLDNGVTFATDNNVGAKTECEYCQQFDDPCGVPMIAAEDSDPDRGIYLYNGFLCASGGEFCEAKVNFCPMCGRKLPEPPKGE